MVDVNGVALVLGFSDISSATATSTFYSMYKRRPAQRPEIYPAQALPGGSMYLQEDP